MSQPMWVPRIPALPNAHISAMCGQDPCSTPQPYLGHTWVPKIPALPHPHISATGVPRIPAPSHGQISATRWSPGSPQSPQPYLGHIRVPGPLHSAQGHHILVRISQLHLVPSAPFTLRGTIRPPSPYLSRNGLSPLRALSLGSRPNLDYNLDK
jgi:hypothetical protein